MKTEKIVLTKDDGARELLAQAASSDSGHIIFTIPKSSQLAGDEEAFKKLKKVAEAVGKTVSIESVDDGVLAAAKIAGLEAANPFFSGIAPVWEEPPARFADGPDEDGAAAPVATPVVQKRTMPKQINRRKIESDDDDEDLVPRRRDWGSRSKWGWGIVLVALVALAYWVGFHVLPRADIVIVTEKQDWTFNNLLTIEKTGPVPSTIISETKNAQMMFAATGKKLMNQKASGTLTVYNAYNSDPQQLVATTRFETPDGKIFRLTKSITIPGAKVESGIIIPSSIEAEVVADKPGPAYNVASPKLVIPGFKGSPKFAGFYGEAKKAFSGGFVGEAAYPTDEDIKLAKVKIASVLEQSLSAQLKTNAGGDYTVVSGATQLTLVKVEVNPQVNAKGEFSLLAEAELKALAFKESDLVGHLSSKMKEELGTPDYVLKERQIAYDTPSRVDFKNQRMSLPIDMKAVAELPVDVATVRQAIAGKPRAALDTIILGFPGVKSATVSLRPFYVRTVPDGASPEKITITLE